jgi:hypothetical protein
LRRRAHPERDLQRAVVEMLKLTVSPERWFFANIELRPKRQAAIAQGLGTNPGWPDLIIRGHGGLLVGIELKAPKGVLSTDQKRVQTAWQGVYHVCKTVDQVRDVLWTYGIRTDLSARLAARDDLTVLDAA